MSTLQSYLPRQMTRDELNNAVTDHLKVSLTASKDDNKNKINFGQLMRELQGKIPEEQAPRKLLAEVLKEQLSSK